MSIRSWIRNLFTRPAGRTIRKAPHRARLSLEALEDRTVPSTFTVFNTNDSGAGSLRDAITQAQSGANLGVADTIVFNNNPSLGTNFYDSTPDIITLTSGQLTLTDTASTTISGPGANLLSISGNNASRVFGIGSGASADLSGLTITAGNADHGSGLLNEGTAALTNCTVSGNVSQFSGGGVFNSGTATLALTDCTINGNANSGFFDENGDLVLPNGGGLFNEGTATLTNCTVSGNQTDGNGGGLFNDGMATLTNCTVSGNNAFLFPDYGGGVFNSGTVTLTNCTVSGNVSQFSGGGVFNSGLATLNNTIVAGQTYGGDLFGTITGSNNLIGGDPMLAPLADNGGPTWTMALMPGSPAINAGSNALIPIDPTTGQPYTTDERGLPRIVNGAVDIGAFESGGFTITITVVSGNNQSANTNTAFANPLAVTVTANNSGEPVAGGVVTFTAPGSGASASFSGNPATIGSDGTASVSATANGAAGSYSVTASAGSDYTTSFNLSNTPSQLSPVFSGLSSQSITYATSTTTLSGHLGAGNQSPPANEMVSITINGTTKTTMLDSSGNFSYAFPTATLGVTGSPYVVTYAYAGDSAFTSVSDSSKTLTVSQAAATVTVTGYTGGLYDGSAHVQTVTVTGVGSVVLFTTSLSGTNAGSYSQAWSFSSISNYNPVNGTLSFAIGKGSSSVSVTATTFTFNNTTQTHGAYSVSGVGTGITQTVTWSYVGDQIDAGTYTATATYAGDANHLGNSASATMTITPVAETILGDVFILNSTASGALTVSGNAQLNVAGTLQVDSRSASAVMLSGNADINAAQTRIVGGDQVTGNAHFLHAVTTGAAAVTNPLAVVAGLTGSSTALVNVSGNQTVTLNPGAYASITVSGNAHLILNPGIYVIGAGGVTVSGNASVTGGTAAAGVLLYNNGALTVSGNASVNLTAFTTGDYAGLAIFQALTDASPVTISGNANLNLNGSFLYDANVQSIVTISGNAQIEASMVVNELTISGNADDTAL